MNCYTFFASLLGREKSTRLSSWVLFGFLDVQFSFAVSLYHRFRKRARAKLFAWGLAFHEATVKATLKWRNPKNAQRTKIIRTSVQTYGDALSAESVITHYDTFSPEATKCRGLRRHKLHILSHAASAMAQSFRCASSPQKVHGLFRAYIEFYA